MKKFITLVALISLATASQAVAKEGCCGTCKKDAAVKEAKACCTTDGSCKKEAGTCAKDAEACDKESAEKKASCDGGTCPLTK